jgi:hypothetical protein
MPRSHLRSTRNRRPKMKNNSLIVRVDEAKKVEFRIAILRQRVTMQDLFETFLDTFIAFDKGEKNPYIERIVKKANES